MKHWVNTISKDHVMRGVAGGFTQANHGKNSMIKHLKAGDWMVFYAPKTHFDGGEPVQAFVAIGQVTDEDLYQVEIDGRMPWRRNMQFFDCREASIRPLIDDLEFIADKTHWGFKFRFGMFEINEHDFNLIKGAMQPNV